MERIPEHHRVGALVPLLAVLLATMVACGGSDSGSAPAGDAAVQHLPEVQEAIEELEGQVGFRPVVPTYLPQGMESIPETFYVSDESQQEAIIAFFPLPEYSEEQVSPTILEITEDPAALYNCPLCPGSGFTDLEVGGEPAQAEEGESGEGVVYYVLYFLVGDLFVSLNAEWEAPEGSSLDGPTPEMKQQVILVAESMLAQG